jgi:hypothetical protein
LAARKLALKPERDAAGRRDLPLYRIFLRGDGAILGREDFEAEGDRAAMILAEVLCDACSDVCDFFELWQGCRRVGAGYARLVQINANMLNADMQDSAVRHEEALRDSRWCVSESRRLLELTRLVPSR